MSRRNTAKKEVGLTPVDVMSVIPRPIPFPSGATRKRVVIERPAPPPVMRTCPTCAAIFEDYTKRANTKFCRSYCRVRMSEIKRDTAMQTLSDVMLIPADLVDEMYYANGGLKRLEKMLNERGYRWDMNKKAWSK